MTPRQAPGSGQSRTLDMGSAPMSDACGVLVGDPLTMSGLYRVRKLT